jgi:hypothetical protein
MTLTSDNPPSLGETSSLSLLLAEPLRQWPARIPAPS